MTLRDASSKAARVAERLTARRLLRAEKIAAREALPQARHAAMSQRIEHVLGSLLERVRPAIIGFCWPHRAEFDCRALAVRWLGRGARACLPLVADSGKVLRFRDWRPESAMVIDRYGIPYPAAGEVLQPDLLLIPVNAFDAQGYRLGYGMGHFDSTLASLRPRPWAIGVGFALARVKSIAPQRHDVPLDAVVTEEGPELFSVRARQLWAAAKDC